MSQNRVSTKSTERKIPVQTRLANTYYALLGLHPGASVIEIRRSYRELSKCYHPDTTDLPPEIATAKFQQLNEAYATLSNPERRSLYDLKIGYSRINVIQAPPPLRQWDARSQQKWSDSAYLDPTDRPLSAGEIFALFILGLTFIGCLLLVLVIGLTRGDGAFQFSTQHNDNLPIQHSQVVPELGWNSSISSEILNPQSESGKSGMIGLTG
ncbi:MAG: J domain-containing protein [Moorea sp. SIO2B7]|nr:J domain-containing protein [Moorena sp. SIO2B7]